MLKQKQKCRKQKKNSTKETPTKGRSKERKAKQSKQINNILALYPCVWKQLRRTPTPAPHLTALRSAPRLRRHLNNGCICVVVVHVHWMRTASTLSARNGSFVGWCAHTRTYINVRERRCDYLRVVFTLRYACVCHWISNGDSTVKRDNEYD